MLSRPAFTLIELLVVIAVIALLAGTVIPAIMQLHHRPNDAMCLQNQTSIFKGMMLYVADNGGMMPKCYEWFTSGGTYVGDSGYGDYRLPWSNMLCRYPASMLHEAPAEEIHPDWQGFSPLWQATVSYVEQPEVFMCPEADRQADMAMWPVENYGQTCNDWLYDLQGTYGLNHRMNNWRRINYWAIAKPSECYMFADSWLQSFDHVAEWDHWYSLRHGPSREFLNIMFSDGHSESTLEADIVTAGDSMPYGVGTPWWGGAWD